MVGLYLNPPEHAVVLCADEKTSVQALDRTQPGLPLVRGRLGTMTHDYKRNGTTTLFAALEMAEGHIIATCMNCHPRFHQHFVPTSNSWLNMVERWFRNLTDKQIRRGVFKSVADLIAAIQSYVDHHNNHPKPFVWTAKAENIIAKYRRAQAVLDKVQTA